MEKLKTIAKSIWAKIPKTKTEFKDLFDRCLSFLERWLHKIWAFLKSAYAWVINFYQKHSKLIHNALYAIAILIWFTLLVIILINLYELYFAKEKPDSWASEVRIAVFTLAAWFGTPFLVWRTMIASKQANTAQEKAYTELFTQAVEQLGSVKPTGKDQYEENIEVRVGALYALERIMHDSDKDAKTIIDTLATYVKHNCGKPKSFDFKMPEEQEFKVISDWVEAIKNTVEEIKTKAKTFKKDAPATRHDIRTALIIIGRRPKKYKTKDTKPDLSGVNFQGAKLEYFDLSFCNLSRAHLQGASMYQVNLIEAELSDVDMQGSFMRKAKMQGVNLTHALIRGADMREANMQRADLRLARMERADMSNVNLQNADLWYAQMQCINLRRANLQNAFLQEAEMQGARMVGAQLQGADMRNTDLQGAKLRGIIIEGANLQRADLRNVEMSDEVKLMAMVLEANT